MKAIRGATTVAQDSAEEIKKCVKELLLEIKQRNSLVDEQIICIMFSNTSDLHSYYPAKAAREAGFISCALYSSLEPEIDGALNNCIRVMLLTETDDTPKHVYLNGAVNLRRDITKKLNIAIDGPAGSGKSSISKILAKKFGILYLDTGAMYRACALACILGGIDCANGELVDKLLSGTEISVKYEEGKQKTLLNNVDVSDNIRTPEISMLASTVSAHECVRKKMVDLQRKIACENSCVLDGRDIGTNVLPSAEYKFFLTASPEVRALRRANENKDKGYVQNFDEVLKEIILRDEQDKTRKIAPLIKAADAIEVDTGDMSIDDVVNYIMMKIQGKI